MKKPMICSVALFLVCVLMPSGAMADFFIIGFYSPFSRSPGSSFSFEFRIHDENGPVEGQTVTFSVSPDDGTVTLNPTSATTDSLGAVTTSLNTGSGSRGVYRVTATAGNSSGGGNATIKTPPPPPELSISVVSGPGAGVPGDTLTFTVEVQEDGSAASGKTVTFSITSGDGNASLNSTSATTGSNGQASTTLTLGGSASGSYTVTATVGSKSTSGTATVDTPSPPLLPELSISVVSGPGSGKPGDTLTFTVEVQEDGSTASGKTVTFSITSGDGNASLNSTSATTGSNGQASTTLTLGGSASGSYTVTATVGSKSTSGAATVDAPEVSIHVVSAPAGEASYFVVEVREDGSPAAGKTVTFSVSPDDGTVSLDPTNLTTNSNGQARALLLLLSGASGSYTVTAAVGSKSTSRTVTVGSVPPPPELSISVVNGPGAGDPGDALTFTVEVQEDGSPVSGKTVAFSITSGDGNASLNPTSVTTDSNGQASTTLTLGNSASGSYAVQATVGSKSTSEIATVGTPPPPPQQSQQKPPPPELSISVVNGPGAGEPGDALTFTVEVQEDGSPVSGKTVAFSITSGDGNASLNPTSVTTGSNGQASTTLTLGNSASGSYTVQATVGSKSTSETATVGTSPPPPQQSQQKPPPPELSISVVNGPGAGEPGDTLPFTVEVQGNGSPAPGKTVTFSITSDDGTASLSTANAITDSVGQAQTMLMLGNDASGAYTITASINSLSVSSTVTVETGTIEPPTSQQQQPDLAIGLNLIPRGASVTVSLSQNGKPVGNRTVRFSVTPDDRTALLSTTSTTTDSDGRASTTLITDSNSVRLYTVTAMVQDDQSTSGTATVDTASLSPPPILEPTALSIVSGNNQTGLTRETLMNPFVVEVRDQYGASLEGVTVTFTVGIGGGRLSNANVDTDTNGLAQSTLTLGNNPGTNTVTASVEGVTETATFNAVAELLEFDLSVQSGTSLIHVPLKVRTVDGETRSIESIADLYDTLGGEDTVKLLITYNRHTQQWNSYLGDESKGGTGDRTLADDLGIVASLKSQVTIRIGGDELGTDGMSTIHLIQGKNLVGLPLKDSKITRVSNLLTLEGISDNAPGGVTVSENGTFKTVEQADDDGDISFTGGQAFILDVSEDATVTIFGDGWDNTSSRTMTAPPLATENIQVDGTTPVLALTGWIVDCVKGINRINWSVIVKNLSTGSAVTTAIEETGGTSSHIAYQLTVVDIEGGRAAAIGDIFEISAISPDDSISVQPLQYTVTVEDAKRHRIQLPALIVQEMPMETQLLPNYPNPFNPETWIPYHLASDAEVQLTIYDTKGTLVCQLDLGHQVVGYYTNRTKAAYWDGRNESGESVASGVYFYQLRTGDVSTTRKMVILK